MASETVHVGILGLGALGRNIADVLTDLGHECYGADADPEARAAFADRYDAPTFDDPDALLAADIDTVAITIPTRYHEAVATTAFDHGLDVLMEKPLAHTLESARRIAEAAEDADAICMVGFQHRFRNVIDVVNGYIDEGIFGEVTHVEASFVRRRGIPGRGTWYTSDDVAGGGALADIGCFALYNVLDFLDWPSIDEVTAVARSEFGDREDYRYLDMWGEDEKGTVYNVEDSVDAFLVLEDGSSVSLNVAWAQNAASTHSYRLLGTEAGADVDVTDHEEAVERGERNDLTLYEVRDVGADHFCNSEIVTTQNDPFRSELAAFLDAVRSGERPEHCNVHRALSVQRAISRIYDACER